MTADKDQDENRPKDDISSDKKIVWLASYPKSGNTWFRAFISHLLKEDEKEFDINKMETHGIYSARPWFDEVAGVDSADMSWKELYYYRPRVYERIGQEAQKDLYIKAHDAYLLNAEKEAIFPASVTKLAVYIIRNPLDVAVSYAHHNGHEDVGKSINMMNDEEHGLCLNRNSLPNQLPQLMRSWSKHVKGWTKQTALPLHVMRFEDMKLKPIETFSAVAAAMGVECSEEEIKSAIEGTEFGKLKSLEEEKGFGERSNVSDRFFRKGEVGSWREKLIPEQVTQIINNHKPIMHKFGYLDKEDQPIF
jgi:hypothetical protein